MLLFLRIAPYEYANVMSHFSQPKIAHVVKNGFYAGNISYLVVFRSMRLEHETHAKYETRSCSNTREPYAQTFLSHGRQPEVETSPLRRVLLPFRRKC